jgi:hypothetical protein
MVEDSTAVPPGPPRGMMAQGAADIGGVGNAAGAGSASGSGVSVGSRAARGDEGKEKPTAAAAAVEAVGETPDTSAKGAEEALAGAGGGKPPQDVRQTRSRTKAGGGNAA